MSVRYYYIRDNKNIQVRHNRLPTRGNPVAVIVSELDRANNCVKYAIATCAPEDAFDKPLGREIAFGRLGKKPIVLNNIPRSGHDITKMIISDIVQREMFPYNIPMRVRGFANHWLSQPRESFASSSNVEIMKNIAEDPRL